MKVGLMILSTYEPQVDFLNRRVRQHISVRRTLPSLRRVGNNPYIFFAAYSPIAL